MSDDNPQIFQDYLDADIDAKMKIEVNGYLVIVPETSSSSHLLLGAIENAADYKI